MKKEKNIIISIMDVITEMQPNKRTTLVKRYWSSRFANCLSDHGIEQLA